MGIPLKGKTKLEVQEERIAPKESYWHIYHSVVGNRVDTVFHSPMLLIDTGTMRFEVIGMEVQHGGPVDGAIVLKVGDPVKTVADDFDVIKVQDISAEVKDGK